MEIVSLLKNDGKLARVQLDDGSIIDNVVILYPYGLFANIIIDNHIPAPANAVALTGSSLGSLSC